MPFQSRDQEEWGDLMNLKPHINFLVLLGKFCIISPHFGMHQHISVTETTSTFASHDTVHCPDSQGHRTIGLYSGIE